MFGKSIKLFTLFGFRVSIDLSWLIILVLVVWSLAGGVFPNQYPNLSGTIYFVMGLAAALGLFASIVFHELSHSLIARQYGLPMKGITLFMFGGVAEMSEEPPSAKAEFFMAVAGPVASYILAGLFFGIAMLGQSLGWAKTVIGVLQWVALINAIVATFNLIPGFPLDGGRILRSILWKTKNDLRAATQSASRVGMGFGVVLIGLGILSLLMGNPIGGLWWILIGMFIRAAAQQGYQQVLVRQALQGEPVRYFMNDSPITVPAESSIHDLVEKYVYRYHHKMFPVMKNNQLIGSVTTRDIGHVPREEWNDRPVEDVVNECDESNTIQVDADAMDALSAMHRDRNSRLMVLDASRLVGILSLKDMLKFLSLKMELEGSDGSNVPQAAKTAVKP